MDLTLIIITSLFLLATTVVIFLFLRKQFERGNLEQKIFRIMFAITAFSILIDLFFRLSTNGFINLPKFVNVLAMTAYFVFVPLVGLLWFFYFAHSLCLEKPSNHAKVVLWSIYGLNVILAVLSTIPQLNLYFSFATGVYVRGVLFIGHFFITLIFYIAALLVILINKTTLTRGKLPIHITLIMMPIIGNAAQLFLVTSPVTIMGIVLSFFIISLNIQYTYANTDFLTGLANRRSFFLHLNRKIDGMRADETFTVLLLDLDDFKAINDQYGHLSGDEALKSVAKLLQDNNERNDFIARFGGDEFVILTNSKSELEIEDYTNKLQARFSDFNQIGLFPYELYFSIGHSVYKKESGLTSEDFIRKIDHLMYVDKKYRGTRGKK